MMIYFEGMMGDDLFEYFLNKYLNTTKCYHTSAPLLEVNMKYVKEQECIKHFRSVSLNETSFVHKLFRSIVFKHLSTILL